MTPQTSDATKGSIPIAHNLTITKKGDAPSSEVKECPHRHHQQQKSCPRSLILAC
jgi:hypothetical protein